MPRTSKSQRIVEVLDGMIVVSLPAKHFTRIRFHQLYKVCDADIYHSEEPSIDTYLTMKMNPKSKHIITFQDPRTLDDYRKVLSLRLEWHSYHFRLGENLSFRTINFFIKKAAQKADASFSQAKYIIPKIVSMYRLKEPPKFLPNPVQIPEKKLKKADEPTVCFLARWDPVKRPELFFELSSTFPNVKFIAIGKAHDEIRDKYLRKKYQDIPNLEMPGLVSEEQKSKILEKSWILINTSLRECLPVSFLEAAAHKCSILSSNNPDDFARNFGYHARNNDYAKGLKFLLENNKWKEMGEKGYKYLKEVHELNKVIDQHIEVYERLLYS
jgi:glycosyltransferase involved in cell wall biosynthesis